MYLLIFYDKQGANIASPRRMGKWYNKNWLSKSGIDTFVNSKKIKLKKTIQGAAKINLE